MTREELKQLISGDFSKLKEKFDETERVIMAGDKKVTIAEILKEYDPLKHDVMNPTIRLDKQIEVDEEEYQDSLSGETKYKVEHDTVAVNRLPMPIQQKIVLIAAAFLVGEKISLDSDPEEELEETLYKLLTKVWRGNKLDYKSKEIAKIMMSETHCAELWYDYLSPNYWKGTINEGIDRKPGVQILAHSKGDNIRAIFDQYNDMIGFMRGYTITVNDKDIEHIDIYTDSDIISAKKGENGWETETKPNPYGFIPVIYYSQDSPEWFPVRPLINRKETKLSDFGDTNDYFGSPALYSEGDVESLPSKGEIGKSFQAKNGGKVGYLTWDSAPESTKLEFEILNNEIHSGTHTPQIDFNTMKGILGQGTSGIALKLLFMDPQMKASDKQEKFGELIQRRLNLMIKMIISFNPSKLETASGLAVSPRFRPYMPVNDVEFNKLLIDAHEAGMISRNTMVEMSSLVSDPVKELEQLDKEEKLKPKEEEPKNLA